MGTSQTAARSAASGLFALALAAFAIGCAQTNVDPNQCSLSLLPKPDRVVVRNFAVTRSEVEVDDDIAPSMLRAVSGEVTATDAQKVGHAAANALADELVKKLVEKGIPAVRGDRSTPVSSSTAIVVGQFQTLDESHPTGRTLVGFGLGGSEVRAHVQVYQGGVLIGETDTSADTTTVSEQIMTSVDAEARRTARQIADEIQEAYGRRGWL